MSTSKMTKKDYFNALLPLAESANRSDLVDFINHELELLTNHKSKPSSTQTANEGIKTQLLEALSRADGPMTITQIQENNAELGAFSNQKISSLLSQLVAVGKVVRTKDKKQTLFTIANN